MQAPLSRAAPAQPLAGLHTGDHLQGRHHARCAHAASATPPTVSAGAAAAPRMPAQGPYPTGFAQADSTTSPSVSNGAATASSIPARARYDLTAGNFCAQG